MSDFDKEAERQRLREKYEKDRRKREATQRMSELLLKGATMTNKHCDTCGDPIFRYDGREFCPTCEAAGAAAGGEEGVEPTDGGDGATDDATTVEIRDAHADETARDRGDADGSTTAAGTEADDAAAGGPEETPASAPSERATPTDGEATTAAGETATPGEDVRATRDAGASGRGRDPAGRGPAGRDPERVEPTAGTSRSADAARAAADLGGVRDSLTRTLARYVEAAEAADDPRRAREYLAAAREAAETLAALRR
jgi:uncharacterized Zn finger protein (UPF0148 family)